MLNNKYEMVLIVDAGLEDPAVELEIEWILNYLAEHGVEVETVDHWGRRRLAYSIKKKSEGFYVVVRFTSPRTVIKEMQKEIGLREPFLRCLLVNRSPASDKAYEEAAIETERKAEQARLRQEELAESEEKEKPDTAEDETPPVLTPEAEAPETTEPPTVDEAKEDTGDEPEEEKTPPAPTAEVAE